MTPSNQKTWFETCVVKQKASLVYAATECYSTKRRYEPSAESHLLFNGGSAFDIVAEYVRGQLDPTVVEQGVEAHFLPSLYGEDPHLSGRDQSNGV